MKVKTFSWDDAAEQPDFADYADQADLIMYFGDRDVVADVHAAFVKASPNSTVFGCSGGGQFSNQSLSHNRLVGAALWFNATQLRTAVQKLSAPGDSLRAARDIGRQLAAPDLSGVIVLSDGTGVNGSDVALGIDEAVGHSIPVFGGLAGDGDRFESTLVGLNEHMGPNVVAAIGLYGSAVRMGHGSQGGWSAMGPKRRITKSDGNVLFEFDGKPALELYERYLGEEAAGLPASALLFPLEVTPNEPDADSVVRTILDIDRDRGALIFAGNVPEGSTAQMMKASHESLTQGAAQAARDASSACPDGALGLMVSCIGRRLLMGQRAEEEVESAGQGLGLDVPHIGFYSYGEICPKTKDGQPQLHNQTMTVSVLREVEDDDAA